MKLNSILVVDDSSVDLEIVSIACACLDCEVETVSCAEEALVAYKARRHSIVLTDYVMEPTDGIQLIRQIKAYDPDANCLIMSGMPDAKVATFIGENDLPNVITKPIRPISLTEQIRIALNRHRGASQALGNIAISNRMDQCLALLGQSFEICQIRKELAKIVNSQKPLLLEGPIGIGKPDIARFIHEVGPFAQSHFVECTCSEMSEDEMREKIISEDGQWGSLLKEAHHGTLVLNNLHDLPMPLQLALGQQFKELTQNCHVITLADGRIDDLFEAGALDTNLYFELSLDILHIPALSERPTDVESMVRFIVMSPDVFELESSMSSTEVDILVAELRKSELSENVKELIGRVQLFSHNLLSA